MPSAIPCAPLGSAVLKRAPEDFVVDEIMPHPLSGRGEHLWCRVEKRNANTEWVARQLARHYGVPEHEVSWAGRKDRHAVTRQWFSLRIPGGKDCAPPVNDEFRVLEQHWHSKKLRTGAHAGNRFAIRLYLPAASDVEQIDARLQQLQRAPFVNLFGDQRFGHDDANADAFVKWYRRESRPARAAKGMLISAMRARLFNDYVAARLENIDWPAERWPAEENGFYSFADGRSLFREGATEAQRRLRADDIVPAAPLFGDGRDAVFTEDESRCLVALTERWPGPLGDMPAMDALRTFCRQQRIEAGRRPVYVWAADLAWAWSVANGAAEKQLELRFALPRGSFATVFLQHVLTLTTEGQPDVSVGE